MNNDNDNHQKKTLKDVFLNNIVIVVSAFPLLGYSATLLYEFGYYSYFMIPRDLISLSSANVLKASGIIYAIFGMYIGTITAIHHTVILKFNLPTAVVWRIKLVVISLIFLLINIFTAGLHLNRYAMSLFCVASIPITCFLSTRLPDDNDEKFPEKSNTLSYIDMLAASDISERNTLVSTRDIFFIIILFTAFLEVCMNRGIYQAENQKEFFISNDYNDHHNIAYLKFLDNESISVEYSPLTKTLTGVIVVEKLPANDRNIKFINCEIGPLKRQSTNSN
jgi:hypothetical protein